MPSLKLKTFKECCRQDHSNVLKGLRKSSDKNTRDVVFASLLHDITYESNIFNNLSYKACFFFIYPALRN